MKTSKLYFLCINVLIVFFTSTLKSQTNSVSKDNWRPVFIQPDKNNTLNATSFFKKSIECNGNKIIIFKIINSNAFPVTITWKNNNELHSLYLQGSANIGGSCEEFNKSILLEKSLAVLDTGSSNDMEIFKDLKVEEQKK